MIKIATAHEMQEIDRVTIEKYGIPGIVLMERAGCAVAAAITHLYPRHKVIVLCGSGNNGGDGLVVARILHDRGRHVEVFLSGTPEKLSGDARSNYLAAARFGVHLHPIKKFLARRPSPGTGNILIVDALLGTGLSRDVGPPVSKIIGKVNRMSCPVISVDIPSGISSDTGQIMGCAVRAEHTVSFGLPKRGHLLYPGAEYSGRLSVEDIGFPRQLLESDRLRTCLVQKEDIMALLGPRPKYSHKGTYGHVLIVAGSKGKTGAALMAARACLRSGAGLVTIGIPEALVSAFQSRVTEEMILPLPDRGTGVLSGDSSAEILGFLRGRGTVLAIGPGLSADREISDLVSVLVKGSPVPIVIDADGLNAIAGRRGVLKNAEAPVILTPHPGEMARLLTGPERAASMDGLREQIEKDRIGVAQGFAKKTGSYLVLKGAPTVIAVPGGKTFVNPTGNPGMATAGTGDVLTGMISAFLAQGLAPQDASIAGAYVHGMTGDIMAGEKGRYSLIASDIIRGIPGVLKSLQPQ